MATTSTPGTSSRLPDLRMLQAAPPEPADSRFAWLVTGAHTWILVGLFLDGWFHIHRPDGESFFTPWHGILYSGVAATVLVHVLQQKKAGGITPGYGPSLAGGLVVGAAGFIDGVWHTVFGVEADLNALLSPPHLLLITAGTLVFAGPLRAALRAPAGARGGLPTALSAAFVVTGLGFFTQYSNPFTQVYLQAREADASLEVRELREVAGVAGVIVFASLVAGAIAILKARTPLVPGSLAVVVAVPSLALVTQQDTYRFVPAILLVALLVELGGRRLSPALAALLATTALTTAWVLTSLATRDVAWSRELLTGSIGSAAAAGYLIGWLVQNGGARADQAA
ncbi:MAG: hypothetical protein JWM62_1952 [Frankiales bacterium]|jgi:hypothetical protein|nr:hypothetical protein [Frankiales bacterium]